MREMAEGYLRKRWTVWDSCSQQTRTILWLIPGTEFWAPDEISSSSEMWDKTSVPLLLQKHSLTVSLLSRLAWPPLDLLFETYCFEWQNNQQVSGADNTDAIFFPSGLLGFESHQTFAVLWRAVSKGNTSCTQRWSLCRSYKIKNQK